MSPNLLHIEEIMEVSIVQTIQSDVDRHLQSAQAGVSEEKSAEFFPYAHDDYSYSSSEQVADQILMSHFSGKNVMASDDPGHVSMVSDTLYKERRAAECDTTSNVCFPADFQAGIYSRKSHDHDDEIDVTWKCPFDKCSKQYRQFNKYEAHMRKMHKDAIMPFQCDLCPRKFLTPMTLDCHVKRFHLENFDPHNRVQKRNDPNLEHVEGALQTDPSPPNYSITMLPQNPHRQGTNISKSLHPESAITPDRESSTSGQTINQDLMMGAISSPVAMVDGSRGIGYGITCLKKQICPICGLAFHTESARLKHFRKSHGGDSELPHKCPTCQKGFFTESMMKSHCQQAKHGMYHPSKCGYTQLSVLERYFTGQVCQEDNIAPRTGEKNEISEDVDKVEVVLDDNCHGKLDEDEDNDCSVTVAENSLSQRQQDILVPDATKFSPSFPNHSDMPNTRDPEKASATDSHGDSTQSMKVEDLSSECYLRAQNFPNFEKVLAKIDTSEHPTISKGTQAFVIDHVDDINVPENYQGLGSQSSDTVIQNSGENGFPSNSGTRPIQCRKCGEKFLRISEFRCHHREKHKNATLSKPSKKPPIYMTKHHREKHKNSVHLKCSKKASNKLQCLPDVVCNKQRTCTVNLQARDSKTDHQRHQLELKQSNQDGNRDDDEYQLFEYFSNQQFEEFQSKYIQHRNPEHIEEISILQMTQDDGEHGCNLGYDAVEVDVKMVNMACGEQTPTPIQEADDCDIELKRSPCDYELDLGNPIVIKPDPDGEHQQVTMDTDAVETMVAAVDGNKSGN